MDILRQSLVTNFDETEPPLHQTEDVLDFGSNFRFVVVPGALFITERDVPRALHVCEVFRLRCICSNNVTFSRIGGITPHTSFICVQ